MRFLFFLILVRYGVLCEDDSNYYVIEVPDPLKDYQKSFKVYWNVPTMQCKSKKIPFDGLYEKYGIIQNKDDDFLGESVAILYDPGKFPALFETDSSGKYVERNGGVPQEGNIEEHVDAFKDTVSKRIPDPDFNGIAIIDFESWRPVFRQNFGVLSVYKDISYKKEYDKHWWWPESWVTSEAKYRFESSAREFMQATISIAKQMRPKARWGYYGFPYCFNMAAKNMAEDCPHNVKEENNQIYWLWAESTGLYPSIYSSQSLSSSELVSLIRGRIREASRLQVKGTPILPYFWYRYRDGGFLRERDLSRALETIYNSEASGIIIWGSSSDVNTVEKCTKLKDYIRETFGPYVSKYTKNKRKVQNDEEFTWKPAIEENSFFPLRPNTENILTEESQSESNITEETQVLDKEYFINNLTSIIFIVDSDKVKDKYILNNISSPTMTEATSTTDLSTIQIRETSEEFTTEISNTTDVSAEFIFSSEITTEGAETTTANSIDASEEKRMINDEFIILFTNLSSQILDFTTDNLEKHLDSYEPSKSNRERTSETPDLYTPTESVDEVVSYIYN
ncbi:unnamed protein product [Pieris brassicae]|uniref:Hyaluronidase n=1 Tax=Pieris brassicae TaxID=7116 RepID=A0A9P0XDJ8_PIEBR|nr:unnamed protein product [Pieris brassicae]